MDSGSAVDGPAVSPVSGAWPDVAARAVNALVVLGALALVYGIYASAAAGGKDVAATFGTATSVIIALVGLYFGIVVGKTGIDQASQAMAAASQTSTALGSEREASRVRISRATSQLSALRTQLPDQHSAAVGDIITSLNS